MPPGIDALQGEVVTAGWKDKTGKWEERIKVANCYFPYYQELVHIHMYFY